MNRLVEIDLYGERLIGYIGVQQAPRPQSSNLGIEKITSHR
jgi:hypothetical protein